MEMNMRSFSDYFLQTSVVALAACFPLQRGVPGECVELDWTGIRPDEGGVPGRRVHLELRRLHDRAW